MFVLFLITAIVLFLAVFAGDWAGSGSETIRLFIFLLAVAHLLHAGKTLFPGLNWGF